VSVIHDAKLIVKELGNSVEAFSINSVPWEIVFSNTSSPLVSLDGGGVSGKVIQPYTWELVRKIVEITNVPVIGPSVWDFDDLEKVRNFGAKAISFGSIFLRYPWRPTLFVKKDKKLKRIRTAT
jgi:dihydroorotate dehydrogenase